MYWSPSPLLELEQHLLALEIRVLCVGLPYHMQAFWVVREQSITALFCRLGGEARSLKATSPRPLGRSWVPSTPLPQGLHGGPQGVRDTGCFYHFSCLLFPRGKGKLPHPPGGRNHLLSAKSLICHHTHR